MACFPSYIASTSVRSRNFCIAGNHGLFRERFFAVSVWACCLRDSCFSGESVLKNSQSRAVFSSYFRFSSASFLAFSRVSSASFCRKSTDLSGKFASRSSFHLSQESQVVACGIRLFSRHSVSQLRICFGNASSASIFLRFESCRHRDKAFFLSILRG